MNHVNKVYFIIIQSGDFWLAYSGLSAPRVTRGDSIAINTELGLMALASDTRKMYSLELRLARKDILYVNINRWFNWQTESAKISHPEKSAKMPDKLFGGK
ncbi:hypothetical protein FPE01S_05_00120 [Flavihumibacter petaseus NBRC 106054]|uniref:Uncharacterized protein n=1 Tax=Flavihumibacter petaseus NBRC 106054 TaxID=1220578 RepID=A0A0E9N7I2_9BACT|nr:hypothetical protein FPE01S_05_00120 [Flavihumibacter petaseus NBRC 106054]